MTMPEGQEVGGRLQRALEAFQKAQGMLLTAHRRLKELSAAEVERFWAAQGSRIEKQLHATAAEVVLHPAVWTRGRGSAILIGRIAAQTSSCELSLDMGRRFCVDQGLHERRPVGKDEI